MLGATSRSSRSSRRPTACGGAQGLLAASQNLLAGVYRDEATRGTAAKARKEDTDSIFDDALDAIASCCCTSPPRPVAGAGARVPAAGARRGAERLDVARPRRDDARVVHVRDGQGVAKARRCTWCSRPPTSQVREAAGERV